MELIHLKGIELMVTLMFLISSSLKMLSYLDEHFGSTKTPVRKNCEAIDAISDGKYNMKYF